MRGSREELDDAHHDSMRTMSSDIQELHAETRKAVGGTSRRQFLIRAGIAGTAITIGSQVLPMSSLWTPAFGQALTDGDIAAYAASVEYAAVAAYNAAISSGKVKNPDVGAAAQPLWPHGLGALGPPQRPPPAGRATPRRRWLPGSRGRLRRHRGGRPQRAGGADPPHADILRVVGPRWVDRPGRR